MKTLLRNDAFNEIMGEITLAWTRRDFEEAFAKVNIILDKGSSEMKAQSLFLQGMIRSDQNKWDIARLDWLEAIRLAENGTFLFHRLQHSIGQSFQMEGLNDSAIIWYCDAIRTCAESDEFACPETLLALLKLKKGTVDIEDNLTVKTAVEKSWRVLELPESPDLADLPNAIVNLHKGFQKLQEQIKGDV